MHHTIPSWAKPLDAEEVLHEYQQEQSYTHQIFNDYQTAYLDNGMVQFLHVGRMLSDIEDVEYYSNLTFTFDPAYEEIDVHHIHVYRDGQWINKLSGSKVDILQREEELHRLVYDGQKTLSHILYDIRVDDILTFSYSRKGKNPAFGNYFGYFEYITGAHDLYMLQLRVLFDDTNHKNLEIRYFDTQQHFTMKKSNELVCYELQTKHLGALRVPDDAPGWYDPWQKALFSNTVTWKAVAKWALDIYHKDRYHAGEEIQALAREFQKQSNDPAKQIVYALQYVQEQVRYFADGSNLGGIVPIDPNESLRMRFADCKNKVVLLKSILNVLHIESYPVLVDTRRGWMLEQYGPSVNSFNHMIIQVWHQEKPYWLDATYTGQSDTLESITQPDYGYALILKEGNKALTKMPARQNLQEQIRLKSQFDLRTAENKLKTVTSYHGSHADRMRKKTKVRKRDDLLKNYISYLQKKYPKLKSSKALEIEDNTVDNILTVTEQYTLDNIWEYLEKEDEYCAFFENDELQYAYKTPSKGERTAPLAMIYPSKVTEEREILLPPAYTEEEITTKKEENVFFSFEKQELYESTQHMLKQTYTFESHTPTIAPIDIPQYIERAREHIYTTYRLFSEDPYDSSGHYAASKLPPNKHSLYIHSKQQYDLRERNALLSIKTIFYGHEAYKIRRRIQSKGADALQEAYLDYYKDRFPKAEVTKPIQINDSDDINGLTLNESYQLGPIWTKDEEEDLYLVYFYNDFLNAAHLMPSQDFKGKYFENKYPSHILEEREILLPIQIDHNPENRNVKNDFFTYDKSEFYYDKSRILLQQYLYRSNKKNIPENQLDVYKKASDKIEWSGSLYSENDPYGTMSTNEGFRFRTVFRYIFYAWILMKILTLMLK
jgi:hypothetical protein